MRTYMLDKSTRKIEDRMCRIAMRKAGMKQDEIDVSQSVVSRPLKEHRVAVLEKEAVYIDS